MDIGILYNLIPGDRKFNCMFDNSYVCGYTRVGAQFVWMPVKGLDISDGIGPTSDHTGSVLGAL